MKFYHIDRIGTLASGMKIENTFTAPTGIDQTLFEKFFPNGLSHWGKSMFESYIRAFAYLSNKSEDYIKALADNS